MHVPDGFLTNRVALSLDALSGISIVFAAQRLKQEFSARIVPIMGVLSAFVFAAQLLNFPLFGGTSGHLVGGALLGIILGPMAGFLTMTTVVVSQALFLQDGGLVAVGANIFNIAAVPTFAGYFIYRLLGAPERRGALLPIAGFLAGWVSVVAAAVACAVELDLSGAVPLRIGLTAMATYHILIGIIEGILTALILSYLARVRPDLLKRELGPAFGLVDWGGALILIAVPLGILALAGSSRLPDPLQALLVGPVSAGQPQESLVSPLRYSDLHRFLIYFALLAVCAVAYGVARMTRIRRGRP